jgi:hypothetical protein
MVTPLVTSLLHFHQYTLFKNMVYILALFGLFWLLFKKLGYFFPNNLVTLLANHSMGMHLVFHKNVRLGWKFEKKKHKVSYDEVATKMGKKFYDIVDMGEMVRPRWVN